MVGDINFFLFNFFLYGLSSPLWFSVKETLASKTKLLRTEQSRSAAFQDEKNLLTTELASSKAEVEYLTQRLNAAAATVGAAAPLPATSEAKGPGEQQAANSAGGAGCTAGSGNALVVERTELRDKVKTGGGR